MTDPHPQQLEIEIDRPRLRTYLRMKAALSWLLLLGSFGAVFGMLATEETLKEGVRPWTDVILILLTGLARGLTIGLLVAAGAYLLFSHYVLGRFASELQLRVEGPFLRLRQHMLVSSDRKLHFRAIVDYAVVQDPLMRLFAISALQMTTTGSGLNSTINVPGVTHCESVRDLLSEIDRCREAQ